MVDNDIVVPVTFHFSKEDLIQQINPDKEDLIEKVSNLSDSDMQKIGQQVHRNVSETDVFWDAIDSALDDLDDVLQKPLKVEPTYIVVMCSGCIPEQAVIATSEEEVEQIQNNWLKKNGFKDMEEYNKYVEGETIHVL